MLRAHRNLHFLVVEEAFVITYKQLRLHLLNGLQDNTYDDDDRCTAERNIRTEYTVEEERYNGHDNKTNCTNKDYIIQDFSQII